jgi:aminoglycoside phosphotransferase (APT) family kinase protein
MTRVPGRIDLDPTAPEDWTRQLADQLVAIHEHAPASWLSAAESPANLDVDVPPTSDRRDLWERAIEVVAGRPPQPPACFVHQDYQQFNVLWSRGRLVGVVDWVWGARGPADADVAHCRLNLCLLYGAERAIAFQTAYESLAGRRVDPWWDVAGVVDYVRGWSAEELRKQAGRRLRVDGGTFPAKVETLLEWVLRRTT